MGRPVRIAPPARGADLEPLRVPFPGWFWLENVLPLPSGRTPQRGGSLLYADLHEGLPHTAQTAAIIPYRDPRGSNLTWVLTDDRIGISGPSGLRCHVLCGSNRITTIDLLSAGQGFPTWTTLDDRVLVARPGDPVRLLGLDDGAEPFAENLVLRDRGDDPLEATTDDRGPYRSALPPVTLVHAFQDRAFANDSSRPDRLIWSNGLGDVEGWPEPNEAILGSGGSDPIVALSDWQRWLLALRRGSVYGMQGTFSGGDLGMEIVKLWDGEGCVAPRSPLKARGSLFWLGQDGIKAWDGSSVRPVPSPLDTLLRPNSSWLIDHGFPRVEQDALSDACAAYYKRHNLYVLSLRGETPGSQDLWVVWSLATNVWSVWTGQDGRCLGAIEDDDGEAILLSGDGFGFVYEQDIGFVDTVQSGGITTQERDIRARMISKPIAPEDARGLYSIRRVRTKGAWWHLGGAAARAISETSRRGSFGRIAPAFPAGVDQRAAGDSTARSDDFVIGVSAVAPDALVAQRQGFAGAGQRDVMIEIDSGVAAAGESAVPASPFVDVSVEEVELVPRGFR